MTKILNHISFAQDWLSKAEEKVRLGQLVEGELLLSLAEAEVHKAWETSFNLRGREKSRPSVIITIALVIVTMFFGIYYFYSNSSSEESFRLSLTEKHEEEINLREENNLRLINVSLSIRK